MVDAAEEDASCCGGLVVEPDAEEAFGDVAEVVELVVDDGVGGTAVAGGGA